MFSIREAFCGFGTTANGQVYWRGFRWTWRGKLIFTDFSINPREKI